MKIVLDTNVLISGLLKPNNPPGQIVSMVSSGTLSLCYDSRLLWEYGEVLRRPQFQLGPMPACALIDQIKADGFLVAAKPLPVPLPDPADEMFLEVAIQGNARCVVTGNLKDFPPSKRCGVPVMSPAEFLEICRRELA